MGIWKVALAMVGLPACLAHEVPVEPGVPELDVGGPWIQGASSEIHLDWPNANECSDEDWTCSTPPSLTMSVVSLQCDGCQLLDDLSGQHFLHGANLRAAATTDEKIEIRATLRFDATGTERTVAASISGDHEVALQATCGLIDSQTLAPDLGNGSLIAAADIRDCSSPRSASDTVLIAPAIVTFHGSMLFPFCAAGPGPCQGYSWHEQQRPRSSILMSVAPSTWAGSNAFAGFYVAVMPQLADTPSVTLSTPLATGELSTTTVAIPPLAARPSAAQP